jgi:hypothetical protein
VLIDFTPFALYLKSIATAVKETKQEWKGVHYIWV